MAFPVVIREREAPTAEHPDGIYEAVHEPFSFKLLKELKQAVLQFGPTSPYTIGLLRGIDDGNRLIPIDWNALAKTCLAPSQFLQFKTWWIDGAETQGKYNQTRNLDINQDQLLRKGDWVETQDQLGMEDHVIGQLKQMCLTVWEKTEVEGNAPSSCQKILRGPQEP